MLERIFLDFYCSIERNISTCAPFFHTRWRRPLKFSAVVCRSVLRLTGRDITYDVEEFKVQDATSIAPVLQRLVFLGKQLEDQRTFANYDIQKDDTLHLSGGRWVARGASVSLPRQRRGPCRSLRNWVSPKGLRPSGGCDLAVAYIQIGVLGGTA